MCSDLAGVTVPVNRGASFRPTAKGARAAAQRAGHMVLGKAGKAAILNGNGSAARASHLWNWHASRRATLEALAHS
jgi:hypothetical protein